GFDALATPAEVVRFFERDFRDAIPLMPELTDDFFSHPTGALLTIRTHPWHLDGRAVLLGDAAHAIVPFYGQGANAAFEDGVALLEAIDANPGRLARAFERYEAVRKPNADAIADLAITNFHEMRDHVASPLFLAKKRLDKLLHKLFPRWFVPLYPMISFSTIPYAEAKAKAERQERALKAIGIGLVLALSAVVAILLL
ncbi:MAG: FAD-dependent monooxygenase, partial [Gemmatimonadota bacterium]